MSTEYFLYNKVTHQTITLCDYDDPAYADCYAALMAEGFYMLHPDDADNYSNSYEFPAIYKSPGIVWDQSEERKTNGDWTMSSREIDSGGGDHSHGGGDHSHGGGDDSDGSGDNSDGSGSVSNPVAVVYNDGRRNNTGMGLYYTRGTHEIGLAPYGTELNTTPSKFIPLWMSDGKNIYNDLPSFPRPNGAREGETTGIVKYKGKYHVVFETDQGKFRKISFEVSDGNGIATDKGETKAKNKWIRKVENKKSIDINGDGVIGDQEAWMLEQANGTSEGEFNHRSFKNKMGDQKLLEKLQAGDFVIYLRHTTTDVDYADQADPDLDLSDCSTQRQLSEQGIAEAEAIGAGFEANDIIIGKVITSEYCRAKDTATLAFGEIDKINSKLNFLPFEDYTDEQLDTYHDRVAPMLSRRNKNGNKIIVGHDDPFEGTTNIYPDPQGTAYILKPTGDYYELIAKMQPNDWAFGADI